MKEKIANMPEIISILLNKVEPRIMSKLSILYSGGNPQTIKEWWAIENKQSPEVFIKSTQEMLVQQHDIDAHYLAEHWEVLLQECFTIVNSETLEQSID